MEGKLLLQNRKLEHLRQEYQNQMPKKLKISHTKIILSSAENMNNVHSEKYGLTPEEIEKIHLKWKI